MNTNSVLPALLHPTSITRRRFLIHSATACAAATVWPAPLTGAVGNPSPNGKTTLAGVGVGGVGFGQLQECEKAGFQIVALCDVDSTYAQKAFDRWPQARRYVDYREMLATEADKVDSVYCGTPDHTHALITLAALRKRKNVCCVKPLTRTISELRTIVKVAREASVATQVTASPNTGEEGCRTCELIWSGAIGEVRQLHLWTNRPVWPQGMSRPPGEDSYHSGLDWNLWLGPAPARPFKGNWPKGHPALTQMNLKDWDPGIQAVYHPFNFRGWWDFGTGALGDMGCHHFNTPFRALKLEAPTRVQGTASKVFEESAPLASMVVFDFPARHNMPPLTATWYDGGLRPPAPKEFVGAWPTEGTLYTGDKGFLLSTWAGIQIFPESAARTLQSLPRQLERRGGTWDEWFKACRGGGAAGCNFDWAGPLTETVLLGNAALRAQKPLEWDAAQMKFTNDSGSNRFLHEAYQNGWSLDAI